VSELYKRIGEEIRRQRMRSSKGPMSQDALAKSLKIAPNTISRWETGTYKPTPEDLDQLARFFGVSITVFFPDLKETAERIAALTSATGGLSEADFTEVVRYAEFRRARKVMGKAKRPRSKPQGDS
jgi:transcriptional regulator with XRE-family HTH domain